MIKTLAKKYLPKKIKSKITEYLASRGKVSYAQAGEDLLIDFLINYQKLDIKNGFFVDIGALHPDIISNTKLFYKKGWKGINVDALPGSMKVFNKKRKKDINIEAVITNSNEECDFFIFKHSAINTLSTELAKEYQKDGFKLEKIIKLKTKKLEDILNENLDKNQKIDLLSIDAEGVDLEVLKSNNWEKYCPTFILIENSEFDLDKPNDFEIYRYLKNLNYKLVAKVSVNLLFQKL